MEKIILGTNEEENIKSLKSLTFEKDVLITAGNPECLFDKSARQSYHLLHSGGVGEDNDFRLLQYLSLNWQYLDPRPRVSSSTWKCRPGQVFIRKDLAASIGGFDFAFETVTGILSEYAYRALRMGGRVRYMPVGVSLSALAPASLADQLRLVRKYLGKRYVFTALLAALHSCSIARVWRGWLSYQRTHPAFLPQQINANLIPAGPTSATLPPYTAVIPTLLRYEYLEKSINSLLDNKLPPAEIIIVDQTPACKRQKQFYRQFPADKVRVYFLDEPGQSTARNLALQKAANELILLFEDDGEAWPDMIEAHWRLLAVPGVDVSTGLVLGPGKSENDIPAGINGYHITDVLATGNAMLWKKSITQVNGLDPAFDRGSGADDDLGRRMYLAGAEIIFNPYAIMTHHKAPVGGMRVHGAWWRNKTTLWAEYPPATQYYGIQKFYKGKARHYLILLLLLKAAKRNSIPEQLILFLLLPYKLWLSGKKAKSLQQL